MKKLSFKKSKKIFTYVKKNFALLKMKKVNLNYTTKLEIIFIAPKNLQEPLIAFSI